jgi:hypothetical protein
LRIKLEYQVETSEKTTLVIRNEAKEFIFRHSQVVNRSFYLDGILGEIIDSPFGFTTGLVHSCLPG